MGKSNKSFTILIGLLFLLFIAAIFYVTGNTRNIIPFSMNPTDALTEALSKSKRISPIQVAKVAVNDDTSVVLIDIRSQYEYLKGHLPKAKNIYKADVLDKENIVFFNKLKNEGRKAILYGNDVVEANTPFMILQQVGIDNVILMESGYDFFENNSLKMVSELGELDMDSETAALDFAKLIQNEKVKADEFDKEEERKKSKAIRIKTHTKTNKVKKTVVTKRKPVPTPAKKIEEEEEEDEGC